MSKDYRNKKFTRSGEEKTYWSNGNIKRLINYEYGLPHGLFQYYKEDGHGFQKVEYRIESFEEIFDFLEEHIGK